MTITNLSGSRSNKTLVRMWSMVASTDTQDTISKNSCAILKLLTKENIEIYICGDFKIDLLKIENNQNYQQFYN